MLAGSRALGWSHLCDGCSFHLLICLWSLTVNKGLKKKKGNCFLLFNTELQNKGCSQEHARHPSLISWEGSAGPDKCAVVPCAHFRMHS